MDGVTTIAATAQQRFVTETGQLQRRGADHFLSRGHGKTAAKDSQLGQDRLLGRCQQRPGVFKNSGHTAMPGRNIAQICFQQVEVFSQRSRNFLDGEISDPGRGQLKAQRQTFYQPANLDNVAQGIFR